jgi:hypothetical protein
MTEIEKLHSEREQQITREPERALAMALDQWSLWEKQGHLQDGRVWMERVLSADKKADAHTKARALADHGKLCFVLGDFSAAANSLAKGLVLARQSDNAPTIAMTLLYRGATVNLRTNIGAPLPDACRDIYLPFEETVKQALGEDAFQSAWQSGE